MEESTASRKLDAVGYEKFIESAVVSSVRRDLFRDRSKPCGARGFATNRSLEFTLFYFGKFLTMYIGWVQSQSLQGPRAFVQKELRATHFEEIHVTKPKSPKRDDHVLHEILLCDAYEPQPPSQWGYGEGDESRVGCVLWFIHRPIVLKLEVLEVLEESSEIQDLSTSSIWVFKGKESQVWRQVAEAPPNDWHKA